MSLAILNAIENYSVRCMVKKCSFWDNVFYAIIFFLKRCIMMKKNAALGACVSITREPNITRKGPISLASVNREILIIIL